MVVRNCSAFLKNRGALGKDSRLQAFLPCICVGHFGRRDIYWIDGRVIHRQHCPMRDQNITWAGDRSLVHRSRSAMFFHSWPLDWLIPPHFESQKSAPFQRSPFMGPPTRSLFLNHLADLRRWRLKGLPTSSGLHVKSLTKLKGAVWV